MAFRTLDWFENPLGSVLAAAVASLDPRELRTVALLDLGTPLAAEEVEGSVRSYRGVPIHLEGSLVMAVFATPFEGVRCALDLAGHADPSRLRARGALHDGLMSDRQSDFVERIPRMTAELADLADEGQLLITDAVEEGMRQDRTVDRTHLGRVRLLDQVVVVFEVRSAQEGSSG
jgi:class 3 adenylate cyclase